ncbi:hypothetical protein HEQ60_05385 [Haematospirillum sp. H1815]|nr:hypothetical protein [Haematospirillum sp. H1815]
MMQDADLADLLCTRLCHDLAGPVGAVVAGMELMADEDDPRLARETVALLKGSADAVSSRLRFLRTVFGMSLAEERDLADLATLCDEWIRATKSGITLLWGDDFDRPSTPGHVGRMILCMIMLTADHLVRGGSISVRSGGGHLDRGVVVAATGTQVTLIPDLDHLLSGQPVVPGPRNAPVILLHQLAMRAGWCLSHAFSKQEITLCATPMRL